MATCSHDSYGPSIHLSYRHSEVTVSIHWKQQGGSPGWAASQATEVTMEGTGVRGKGTME